MPNTITQSGADKPSNRPVNNGAKDSTTKLADRVEQTFVDTAPATADKALQVRDEVVSAAHTAVTSVKDAAVYAKDEASALLHDAREAAVDTYYSARDQTLETAHEVSQLAQRAAHETADYLRRASSASGRFATVHALPLTLVGVSLAWLAVSVRNDRRRTIQRSPAPSHVRATVASRRSPAQGGDVAVQRTSEAPRTASTTSGAKLMGVRARDLDASRGSSALNYEP